MNSRLASLQPYPFQRLAQLIHGLTPPAGLAPIRLSMGVVSQTKGGEYAEKMAEYAELGVLYYTIYNSHHWRRDKHTPFEVYRLVNGAYVQQTGDPVWMPEVGLGIGTGREKQGGWEREWLYWFDDKGDRYLAPESLLKQARQQVAQERQRAEQERRRADWAEQQLEQERQRAEQERRSREELLERLRVKGINLDEL